MRRGRLASVGSFALLSAVVVALQLTYSEPALLSLAPALALFAPLVFGCYPGERVLLALTRAWHRLPRQAPRAPRTHLAFQSASPRGGALLAISLAGRGPPG